MFAALAVALSCFVLVVTFLPVRASAVPAATVQYLKNQPREAWNMMALRAANVEGLDAVTVKVDGLTVPTDIEKAILGVVAAHGNPFSINNINLVAQLDQTRQQKQIGEPQLLNDDIFGILAYLAAGYPGSDERIAESRSFVVREQNSDGGFAFAVGQPSDTNITAMALTALIRSGLPVSDTANQKALSYLLSTQNDDGGFGYAANTESDAASTAWIITALRAATIDAGKLEKNSQTPYEFLSRLAMPDGTYKWKINDGQGSSIMAIYTAIALSNSTYPVAVYVDQEPVSQRVGSPTSGSQPVPAPAPQIPSEIEISVPSAPVLVSRRVSYRIEGREQQLCQGETSAATALQVLSRAAEECGFTYVAEQTPNGVYVKQVGVDAVEDNMGWLYLVNWKQPQHASDAHALQDGDYVTWFYGEPSWTPLWMTFEYRPGAASIANPGHAVLVKEYRDGVWAVVSGATVWAGGSTVLTDAHGRAFIPGRIKTRWMFAYKDGHVRSHGYQIAGQENAFFDVMLRSQNNGIKTNDWAASFVIHAPASTNYGLDFGSLERGQTAIQNFVMENVSDIPLMLDEVVLGRLNADATMRVNGLVWPDYRLVVAPGKSVTLQIAITANERIEHAAFGTLVFIVTQ